MRDKYASPDDDLSRTDELPVLAEDAVVPASPATDDWDPADTSRQRTVRVQAADYPTPASWQESSAVQALEGAVKAVLRVLDERQATHARLEKSLEQRDVEVAELRAEVSRQRKELDTLRAATGVTAGGVTPNDVESLTERIAEMERELEQRITREQALEKSVHESHSQVEELRSKLAAAHAGRQRADAELERLGRQLAEGERSIDRQNERLTALHNELGERVAAPLPVLVCLTSAKPERHVVSAPETLIGRGSTCAIRLVTHSVSREHARLRHENGKVVIHDCGSKNGVFVNSVRVERHELEHGDSITIGGAQFRFLLEGAKT